ncbi:conserved hypothetical protein [Carnobacterium maltaromaticum]|uniref:helix-turn-helix domain-containing protein n=1 Tax=Carnobacterium maltaromaticum TaxID=2751 RepID=UPI00191BBE4C|nr:helix-turn-helix domain-containing protein [Carnobacterium maltaromaticum]CAD5896353.1 conserved hypothetical protein [Carnobacterium maltaromaticum]
MKKLLNVQYLPYFNLLKYCSKRPSTETTKDISIKTNLDRRILVKIIEQLQTDIINNNWFDVLNLELIDSELTVTCGPLFSLDFFYSHYMSKSFCVELTLQLFQHQSATVDEFLDYFYISQATFYRRIAPLRQVLAEFNLELNFINKKNIIQGDEKQIRHFFFTFFWEIFNSIPTKLNSLSTANEKELHSFTTTYNLPIPLAEIITIHLTIALTRIKQGFYLREFPPYSLLRVYISRADFNKQFEKFFDTKKLMPEYLEAELNWLFFLLVTGTLYPPTPEKDLELQRIDWFAPSLVFSQKWIAYYKYFFGYSLSNADYFYLLLNLYLIQLKSQVLIGDSLAFSISTVEELLPDTPYTLDQINRFFDFLDQKEAEFHLTSFQRVTYARLIRRIISKSRPALQILVCSKVGKEETEWMNEFIQKISPIPLTIHSIWTSDLDLIISDYSIRDSLIPDDLTHYFLCSSFSGFDEWPALLNRIEELYYTKTTSPKIK